MQFPDLREYAINYLSRYNNTEVGLSRLLMRKVNRWLKQVQREKNDDVDVQQILHEASLKIDEIIKDMKRFGYINDENFVNCKIPALIRGGYSKKMIQNRFIQKGVDSSLIASALHQYEEKEEDLLSALIYARKRRVGPFRHVMNEENTDNIQKEQMILARRGFSYTILNKVLSMNRLEAEDYIDKAHFI